MTIVLLVSCLWQTAHAYARIHVEPANQVRIRDMAAHPAWLRLLHLDAKGHPQVGSSTFWLASDQLQGKPEAELAALLERLVQQPIVTDDDHPVCRFPARITWLVKMAVVSLDQPPHDVCPKLNGWTRADKLKSISVLLVSGYLGNPASTFGHSLLRLNTSDGESSGGLMDTAINFGAVVPEGDPMLLYMLKGLMGFYQAGFSTKSYHSHDLIYSGKEYRDIWEYELNLDKSEILFLAYHLWEMIGQSYKYYFLRENCTYRMAEVISVVGGGHLLGRSNYWYAPVELFHRLGGDGYRNKSWISKVNFIPSTERVLQDKFAALDVHQQQFLKSALDFHSSTARMVLDVQTDPDLMPALDLAVEYVNNPQVFDESREVELLEQRRTAVLSARLALPQSTIAAAEVATRPSPADMSPPMRTSVGWNQIGGDAAGVNLQFSVFSYELTGFNGLENSEVAALDFQIAIRKNREVRLDQLDLIRVKKLNVRPNIVTRKPQISWEAEFGMRSMQVLGKNRDRFHVTSGIGYATSISSAVVAYLMTDFSLFSNPGAARIHPHLGTLVQYKKIKLWASTGAHTETRSHQWRNIWQLTASYALAKDSQLRLDLATGDQRRQRLSFVQYW